MPSLRISLLQGVYEMIADRQPTAPDKLELIENVLTDLLVQFFGNIGQPISADDIEVLWNTVVRAHNAPGFYVEVHYSEKEKPLARSRGFVTTPKQRYNLKRKLLSFLKKSKLIPEITVGVWVKPQHGATFGMAQRTIKRKKKNK